MQKQSTQIHQITAPTRVLKERTPVEDTYKVPERHREEFLRMKQALKNTLPDNTMRALLFSSSSHGEGTTTVVSQFAIILANSGDKVLLVDANLRNPTLHSRFHLVKECGFSDLVVQTCSSQEAMKQTKLKNLSVITSGSADSNPYCLFEPKLMKPAVDELRKMADWVLFETSAVNDFNDALSLATLVDGIVLIIQAEKTRWEVAQCARDRIMSINVPIIGTILNRRKTYIPNWIYSRL